MTSLILHDPIFRFYHYVVRSPFATSRAVVKAAIPRAEWKEVEKAEQGLWGEGEVGGWAYTHWRGDSECGCGIIWLNATPPTGYDMLSVLIHEAGHMAQMVLHQRGAWENPIQHNEVERLYQDWLVREARRKWRW